MDAANLSMPTTLCLYGSGRELLDCFELLRLADHESVFTDITLAAAATGAGASGADVSELAQEAADLGIVWHEDVEAMLAAEPAGLLLPLGDDAPLPEATCRVLPPGATRLLFTLLSRAATRSTCSPDLARARRMLATVLDRMDDEIALLDSSGMVLDANATLAARLESSRASLVGLAATAVFPDFPDLRAPGEHGRLSILDALGFGRKVTRKASQVDDRGRLRYFRLTFYPVPDHDGTVAHVAAVRRDVTQDVFLERRLQKSERLAAIGELSMFISHEIRNPLFAIAGFANALVRARDLDETSREKASIILSESKRLDDILKDIINFSRPTTSTPGEVDLGEVATRTTGLMRLALEKQGIDVRLDLSPQAPMARGDPETLTQCLLNCLNNAMEAMADGGHIIVSTGMVDGRAALAVRDDGPGIAPEDLSQVFNPFFTTRAKRAGLGLAMTKKILEDQGGAVELASELGCGTTVTLLLPPFLGLAQEDG